MSAVLGNKSSRAGDKDVGLLGLTFGPSSLLQGGSGNRWAVRDRIDDFEAKSRVRFGCWRLVARCRGDSPEAGAMHLAPQRKIRAGG